MNASNHSKTKQTVFNVSFYMVSARTFWDFTRKYFIEDILWYSWRQLQRLALVVVRLIKQTRSAKGVGSWRWLISATWGQETFENNELCWNSEIRQEWGGVQTLPVIRRPCSKGGKWLFKNQGLQVQPTFPIPPHSPTVPVIVLLGRLLMPLLLFYEHDTLHAYFLTLENARSGVQFCVYLLPGKDNSFSDFVKIRPKIFQE